VVDEQSAGTDQGIPRAENGQVGLRLGRAVVNGEEQAGVEAGETGKGLGVGPVGLSRIAVIALSLRALATRTSCPSSLSRWLAQRECVPTSIATRAGGKPENFR